MGLGFVTGVVVRWCGRGRLITAWQGGAGVAGWCGRGRLITAWQGGVGVAGWCGRGRSITAWQGGVGVAGWHGLQANREGAWQGVWQWWNVCGVQGGVGAWSPQPPLYAQLQIGVHREPCGGYSPTPAPQTGCAGLRLPGGSAPLKPAVIPNAPFYLTP